MADKKLGRSERVTIRLTKEEHEMAMVLAGQFSEIDGEHVSVGKVFRKALRLAYKSMNPKKLRRVALDHRGAVVPSSVRR